MDDALKNYLAERGATEIDPRLLEKHFTKMIEEVIPQIIDDIKERDQLAAELRSSPSAPARTQRDVSPLRVLVCGGRDYSDREALFHELHELALRHGRLAIIQGGTTGADALAREWACLCKHTLINFPADWRAHGRAAGPIRNAQMIREGRPELVLAFPGGRGTADMVRQARAAGVEVREIEQ